MTFIIGFVSLLCFAVCVHSASISSSESPVDASGDNNSNRSKKFYDGDNDYGYAEVRSGAFMFWWLYYAGGDKNTAYEKPFVIWIQGGPSIPGAGVGNFLEIGPQDMQLNKREFSWVNKRNVLFIDSPVGTGFSYVNDDGLLVRNDKELAHDLVELMKQFLRKFPKFETVPTHIFSQSYGGKIAPRFAYYLHKEIKYGRMKMNLKSVGMGSAFVSPADSEHAYAEYMYYMGYLDQAQYATVKDLTQQIAKACDKRQYKRADELRHEMLNEGLSREYLHFNIFNVITPPIYSDIQNLQIFMDWTVKHALSDVVPVNAGPWEFSNETIVDALKGDIMKPSIHFVEKLLNETDITLIVYNGNLDAATPIAGAVNWVHRLRWHGADKFRQAPKKFIRGYGNGHYKTHGRLSFWWVYKAGHWVPSENPVAMEHILNEFVDSAQENKNVKPDFTVDIEMLRNLLTDMRNKGNSISSPRNVWLTDYPITNQTAIDIPTNENHWTTEYPIVNNTLSETATLWETTEKQVTIDNNTVLTGDVA